MSERQQRTWLGMPVNGIGRTSNKGVWNPGDSRLFPPKRIGIGRTINFYELLKRLGIKK